MEFNCKSSCLVSEGYSGTCCCFIIVGAAAGHHLPLLLFSPPRLCPRRSELISQNHFHHDPLSNAREPTSPHTEQSGRVYCPPNIFSYVRYNIMWFVVMMGLAFGRQQSLPWTMVIPLFITTICRRLHLFGLPPFFPPSPGTECAPSNGSSSSRGSSL